VADASAIASRMIRSLALSDPDLDTSVGSVTRKIIDAVAEQLAEVEVSQDLLSYRFDIDSKHGADLDDFALMFGFTRLPAGRAYGTITLFRPAPAPQAIYIPVGTQVATSSANPVVFATVAPAYMAKGTATVEIPIQALVGGESGNLPANSLTVLVNAVEDLSSNCTNVAATTGGTDEESDEAFIARFKRTVFRSLAGTEDMYLGVALEGAENSQAGEHPTRAKVLGVTSRWREQVQIESDGTATSSIPAGNAKYIFEDSFVLGPDIANGQIFTPGVHYTVNTAVTPPVITSISLENGAIYDMEFEYTSSASRNNPALGISNRVDVWVNGEKIVEAGETFTFSNSKTFTTASGDPLNVNNFVRLNTNNIHPSPGSVFSPLSYGPIHSFPDTLSVAGVEYREGVDYYVVHDDTAFGYGPTSRFGLEWVSGQPRPANGTQVGVNYYYNRIPREVEARIRRWRLVGQDARAHQAKPARLVLHIAVMYTPGSNTATVDNEIFRALSRFLGSLGFAAVVQISDLLQAIRTVSGVDAVRFTTSSDNPTAYGIQEVTATGVQIKNWSVGGRPVDVLLKDNQIPVLHDLKIYPRAQNTIYDLG
jgi:uncharacterized phage protein gp47/JayE